MNNEKIKIYDEDGCLNEYEPLISFDSEEFGKSYVIFRSEEKTEDGEPVIKACSTKKIGENALYEPVTDSEELDMVNDVFQSMLDEL